MSSLTELTRTSAKIGVLSFGGPAAQIALMHKIYVDEKKWISEDDYLSALSFCMLLPGPEAMQLATYTGWKLHGVKGGLIAGGLFVLPGAIVMMTLAALYAAFGTLPLTEALFLGIKACVVVFVIEALLRVAKRALKSADRWLLALASFIAIFVFDLPFPLIVLGAALYGFLAEPAKATTKAKLTLGTLPQTVLIWGALWAAPIALAAATGQRLLTDIGLYFSKLAVITFGGAYAVLAYMAQSVVAEKQWLTTDAMMDGFGLAETTPGPLILVTEFIGFQAGFNAAGWTVAVLAALMTLWTTFVPCFLWIFAGAPFIAQITARPRLKAALSAITAAVVGVILSLSLWFALNVLFGSSSWPDLRALDWRALLIMVLAGWLLLIRHANLFLVLGLSALAGLALSLF
jgi:chromate transporter